METTHEEALYLLRGWRDDAQGTIIQVGTRVLHAAFFAAGHRVAANKMLRKTKDLLSIGDDASLGAADIGEQRARLAARGGGENLLDDAIDRRAEDDHVGAGCQCRHVEGDFVE